MIFKLCSIVKILRFILRSGFFFRFSLPSLRFFH